jgi:hypothetical protein
MFQTLPSNAAYPMSTVSAIAPPGAVQHPEHMSHIFIDGPLLEQMNHMSLGKGQGQISADVDDLGASSPGAVGPPPGHVGSVEDGN